MRTELILFMNENCGIRMNIFFSETHSFFLVLFSLLQSKLYLDLQDGVLW